MGRARGSHSNHPAWTAEMMEGEENEKGLRPLGADLRRIKEYLAAAEKLRYTGSWVWHVRTADLFWSNEHFWIFGLEPGQVASSLQLLINAVHPDDRRAFGWTLANAVRHQSEYAHDYRIVRPSGEVRRVRSRAHPVFDEAGELTQYIGTTIDIAERFHAEQALAELAHVTRLTTMGELAASLVHELRQPVAAMSASAGAGLRWLNREPPDLTEARAALEHIVQEGNRAAAVLTLARGFLTKSPLEARPFDIGEAIREIFALVHSEILRYGILVTDRLADGLPPVQGDRVQIQQVALNLLVNAIEAMKEVPDGTRQLIIGSLPGEVDVGPGISVFVTDSGVGFSEEQLARLFDAFYTTKRGGLGMGLPICRAIIDTHRGALWAEASPGRGATFWFVLPVAEAPQRDAGPGGE